jgi:hypothetical protein
VTDDPKNCWELGSDLPLVDPAEDAFGYAPFASLLAEAIVGNRSPQGLVLAVHGKWGGSLPHVVDQPPLSMRFVGARPAVRCDSSRAVSHCASSRVMRRS